MTLDVFLLVLTAALLHAGWNYLARKVVGDLLVIWLALCVGCGLVLPAAIGVAYFEGFAASVPTAAWGFVGATGLLHAIYFSLLAVAYQHGELSLVYPIARGSGVGLTAVLAGTLLHETVSGIGAIGIGLVVIGISVMAVSALSKLRNTKGIMLALCVGIVIAGYSLTDKLGVSQVNPVLYIWLMSLLSVLLMWPLVIRFKFDEMVRCFHSHQQQIIAIGAGTIGTYLIILFAFTKGSVNYIVAVRETSIVFAALLAVVLLKERLHATKVAAIVAIVSGVILIKIG